MKTLKLSRRDALAQTGVMVGSAVAAQKLGIATASAEPSAQEDPKRPFRFCLNTATIRGQKLGIVKEIEVAANAGYDALEPWVDSIEDYVKNGGGLKDLRKRMNLPE